ncbi:glucose-6-phosphate isomerase [Thermoanaerobacterium thermosaccharolyticum]|uniref:glucose-6-phosphate isomerase n=1 Tax=Thermoanaerobacterium thermosaccharolyticum TaxID=1517 RepID=A0A223HZ29_THETR|nr:glucose-6-phosphate isomerase family protein [Thermoanaerobacterium thermosaccharolyticum]AST57723.1 glucose-6-phosphate isomerase [Thermoanaerobacterium thermosaccharolyticum]
MNRKVINNCPLPIMFAQDNYEMHFTEEVNCLKSVSKSTSQMKNLLKNPDVLNEDVFYTFYEGVMMKQDVALFAKHKLRYDLIVVRPGCIGDEFKKTSGHYHCQVPNQGISYPEIYEVMQGNAVFVLQKSNENGDIIEAYAVKGNPGDKLLIPPDYGHVAINIGNEPLIFADLVSSECSNMYGPIGEKHGMSYYITKDEIEGFKVVMNPNYINVANIQVTNISENPSLGIFKDKPIYEQFVENPALYDYLNSPIDYMDKFIKF